MMVDPKDFYSALLGEGLDFFTGVPDSLLKHFCAYVAENAPAGKHVIAANEGGAVGIACGYHIATGRYGVVYMQNSGEGNAVNPLLSIADPDVYSIPLLLVVGWRGQPGVHDEPQHVKQGKVTCGLLEAMGIAYRVMDESWREQLSELACIMRDESRPVALVVPKGSFSAVAFEADCRNVPLSREEMLRIFVRFVGDDELVVSTTGKASRELFEVREACGQGHANDFLTVGGMGHASSIALGMSLGTNRTVWCVDGDGALLMHAGSLAVAAQVAGSNFKYIVNDNGVHESVGGQPIGAPNIDLVGVLSSMGFKTVSEASDAEGLVEALEAMRAGDIQALVVRTRPGSRPDLGRPTTSPQENKCDMMGLIGSLGA